MSFISTLPIRMAATGLALVTCTSACGDSKTEGTSNLDSDAASEVDGSTTDGSGGSGGRTKTDSSATGGAGGSQGVCGTAPYSNVFRFLGSSSDAWSINRLSTPLSLVPGTTPDGGVTGTLLEIDRADGNPAAGSVKLTIPFDNPGEQLIFQQQLGGTTGVNLTGATLSALVMLDSLANGAIDSTVQAGFALKSVPGLYTYAAGPSVNLQTGSWIAITMSADSAPIMNSSFDNCAVLELDVLIGTSSSGTYGTAVVHVDTIAIITGDAGVPPEPGDGK